MRNYLLLFTAMFLLVGSAMAIKYLPQASVAAPTEDTPVSLSPATIAIANANTTGSTLPVLATSTSTSTSTTSSSTPAKSGKPAPAPKPVAAPPPVVSTTPAPPPPAPPGIPTPATTTTTVAEQLPSPPSPTKNYYPNPVFETYTHTGENPIPNPTFEVASSAGAYPNSWYRGRSGTNDAVFTYPVAGHGDNFAAQVTITNYTSGEAKWYFQNIPAHGGQAYFFSDYYASNASSTITAQFLHDDGTITWMDLANPGPVSNWTRAVGAFYVPRGTVSMTVYHLLENPGTLTVDDFALSPIPGTFGQGMVSINFDDGWLSAYTGAFPILKSAGVPATFYMISRYLGKNNYMTQANMLEMQDAGEEIGAHTRAHSRLTLQDPVAIENEIAGSIADLRADGANISTFAYPYGVFNAQTDATVRQAKVLGARTIQPGLNFPESNPYLLKARTVTGSTTVAQVQSWINEAVADKQWLILVFHELDTKILTGDSYSWSSGDFKQIVDYLSQNHVQVVTVADGLRKYFKANQ